jgi:RimJ/RimL family protein N-acetyltransferase
MISTARLILRYPQTDDAQTLYRALTESAFHLKGEIPFENLTLASCREIVKSGGYKEMLDLKIFTYYAFENSKSEFVGSIIATFQIGNPTTAELAFWLHVNQTQQGYMTEMVNYVTEIIFKNTNILSIVIRCRNNNIASIKVAKRAGYTMDDSQSNPNILSFIKRTQN